LPLYVQDDKHAQGAYTCAHLETDGVHMKTPPLYNFAMVYLVQAYLENRFNEGFLKLIVSPKNSIANERKTYAFLESQDFNTLRLAPEQHLINGLPVLMTKRIQTENLAELILDNELTENEIYESYATAGKQMRRLHDLGVYWGDAKPGNIMKLDKTQIPFDFGPIVNTKLEPLKLQTKDAQIFLYEMMIARGQIRTDDALDAFYAGYQPSQDVRLEISRSISRQKNKYFWNSKQFLNLYLKTFHKCEPQEFLEIENLARKLAA